MREVVQETTGLSTIIFILKPADQDPAWDWGTSDPRNDTTICQASTACESEEHIWEEEERHSKKWEMSKMPHGLWHTHSISFSNRTSHFIVEKWAVDIFLEKY